MLSSPGVLLCELTERTSAQGNRYLAGWLGKARLVAFMDRDAPEGEVRWLVFAQEPEPRASEQPAVSTRRCARTRTKLAPGELDDDLPDLRGG